MRGKENALTMCGTRRRITPAYAGKSRHGKKVQTLSWDHPRLCGEKIVAKTLGYVEGRITPAYAGKSRLPAYCT